MNKTIKTFLVLSFITATCWAYLLGDYMGTSADFSGSTGSARFDAATGRGSYSGGSGGYNIGSGSKLAGVNTSDLDLGFFTGRMFDDNSGSSGSYNIGSGSRPTIDTSNIDFDALFNRPSNTDITQMLRGITGQNPTAIDYQNLTEMVRNERTSTEVTTPEITVTPLPVMSFYEQADFNATVSRIENEYGINSSQAREVATNYYFGESSEDSWLGDKWSCPAMSKDLASIIQEVTGKPARDAYGRAAYEQDIIRFSNYYQIDQNQAKEALDLYLSDHTSGNMWIEKDPADGEFKEDYLEVGPETGVGYPICPIMSNDIQSYLNYAVGAGPRPEAPTFEDIERIKSGQFTEMDVSKVNEIQGTLGVEGQQMGQDEIYEALMVAMNDSGYNKRLSQNGNELIDNSTFKELLKNINVNDIKDYSEIMDRIGGEYGLETNNTMSALIRHIADQRTANPNYKLSEENNIIGSINTSGLYDIIKNMKDAKTKTGSVSAASVDLNHDGEIDLIDSAILMSFWGENSSGQNSDINKDGNTNLTDYSIMMSYWNYAFK